MKSIVLGLAFCTALAVAAQAQAAPINATLGKPVSVTGTVGVVTCCWPDATFFPPAALSTITDGIFRPEGTEWQDGTVWWDEGIPGSNGNLFTIELQRQFLINTVLIQADNNDFY